MDNQLIDILKKYWGHQSFRPLQEEIVQSVLSGSDTVALLPTGGGKSICFQVPAMAMKGVCIVVSPLIALMNDQVHNLRLRGISAIAINSALSSREIDVALDNAVYGNLKFIYLSPERLKSDVVQARIKKMNVSLVAIDEAHCISEWGHDFRPAYREIAELRELLPNVPIIALTATATQEVVDDIVSELHLKDAAIFRKSFVRSNLIYVVQKEQNRLSRICNIVKKVGGSGIVYVPTRRETVRMAHLLRSNGIGAMPYHGGMDFKERSEAQELWVKNKAQVVVATNAFGMGIDKPDVRFVVHIHLPQTIEAYFQEAGRAGRDGKQAYAIYLMEESDITYLRDRVMGMIPDEKTIIQTFRALVNHLQLALGSKMEEAIPFDVSEFSKKYKFNPTAVVNSLKMLEYNGYLTLSDAIHSPSRIQFMLKSKELYSFEVTQPRFEKLIHLLLRSYEGLFEQPVRINENNIGTRLKIAAKSVKDLLNQLHQMRVLQYQEQTDLPFISFPTERLRPESIVLDKEFMESQKRRYLTKMNAAIAYAENNLICRSVQLVSYFGDQSASPCGKCDVCLSIQKHEIQEARFYEIKEKIENQLSQEPIQLYELSVFSNFNEKDVLKVIQWMADNNEIFVNTENDASQVVGLL